jgi:RNA polymerase sigma-70 factor (ECF subfamily)
MIKGYPEAECMTEIENEDALLLRDLIAGDEWAFTELYRRRRREIYRFAFAMTRSAALAQDVMQDVFLRLLEDATRFDPSKGSVRAWLLGCARHVVLDRLRAESRWTAEPAAEDGPSAPCSAEDAIFAEQRLAQLHAAILGLPMEYREAVALCEIAELSYAECAAVVGCPIGTVRSRLHRARALLARQLAEIADNEAPLRRVNEACG